LQLLSVPAGGPGTQESISLPPMHSNNPVEPQDPNPQKVGVDV